MKFPQAFAAFKGLSSVYSYIKLNGRPITVAQYMKYVLTNPIDGYYTTRDGIGERGDFLTSPEISQIFGEIIGVWVLNEWFTKLNQGNKLNIIELGPGHGTLTQDIQRVFSKYPSATADKISFHLVESSSKMAAIQADHVTARSIYPTRWYDRLEDVPRDPAVTYCILANEFFDALPIHKYQKTTDGWREIMIDFDENENAPPKLVYKLGQTPLFPLEKVLRPGDGRRHVEISFEAGRILNQITDLLALNRSGGSFGLICDYGHGGHLEDTFRAFKGHKLHDPLQDPGTADLTADVDFDYCTRCLRSPQESRDVEHRVNVFGPVNQGDFLEACGGRLRLNMLLANVGVGSGVRCKGENKMATDVEGERRRMIGSYDYLINPAHMGHRFKFLAFNCFPHLLALQECTPPGFQIYN